MMMTTIIVTVTMTTIMIKRMMLCHYDGDDGNGDSDGTIILQVLTSCPGDPVVGIGHLAAFVVKVFNAHY